MAELIAFPWLGFLVAVVLSAIMVRTIKIKKAPVWLQAIAVLLGAFGLLTGVLFKFDFFRAPVAQRYFDQLCATRAHVEIYRDIKEIDGFLILKAHEKNPSTNAQKQFGENDPYALAIGNTSSVEYDRFLKPVGPVFTYVERPMSLSAEIDKVTRSTAHKTNDTIVTNPGGNGPNWKPILAPRWEIRREANVPPISKYGYNWGNDTTLLMRFFWIGAGHVEVIDLTSKELVARQSGFSLLADTDKGVSKYGWWGPAKVCPTGEGENIGTFLRSVFKPNKK